MPIAYCNNQACVGRLVVLVPYSVAASLQFRQEGLRLQFNTNKHGWMDEYQYDTIRNDS